jgi:hypothetical protein
MEATDCMELVPYGFSILDYARRYDHEWIGILHHLRILLGFNNNRIGMGNKIDRKEKYFPLPSELLLEIFTYFDGPSLASSMQVNREWHSRASQETFWERALLAEYFISAKSFKPISYKSVRQQELTARQIYKKMHRCYRRVAFRQTLPFQHGGNLFSPQLFR